MSDKPPESLANLKHRVVYALTWTAGARLAGQAFTWAITIWVIRLLSPQDYGLMAMATIFIAFFGLFAEIGLGPALVQAKDLPDSELRRAFGTVLLVNYAFFLALVLGAPAIAAFFAEPRLTDIVRVLAVQFLIGPFNVIPSSLLQRRYELKTGALIDLGGSVVTSVTTLALAYSGFGTWSLVIGSLAALVYRTVACNVRCPYFLWPHFALPSGAGMVRFGVQTVLSRLAFFLYSQTDIMIAGKMLGKDALGCYSVASHLASLPVQKTASIMFSVAFPTFALIQGDRKLVQSSVLKGIRVLSLGAFPVLFGISCTARELVAVVLGPSWADAVIPIQLLALIMPLRSVSTFLFAVSDGVGRADVTLKSSALALVVMPVALVIGSHWGLVGFSVAWLLAYPIVFLANTVQAKSALGMPLRSLLSAMGRPALAASGMYLAVIAARTWWPWQSATLAELIALVLTGVLAYVAGSLAINRAGCVEALQLVRNRK